MSDLYFLTVNYYSTSLIDRLLDSLATNTVIDYQFIIVNNSPDDHQLHKIKRNSVVIIESSKNLGFGAACNLGLDFIARENSQAIVWLINPDTYFVAENSEPAIALRRGQSPIAFFNKHSHISILGTTVYKSSGEVDFAGGTFVPEKGTISTINLLPTDLKTDYVKSDWISGCSLLINLRNFKQCPQFDNRYFLYYEDFDFCRRYAEQGHQIAVTQRLSIIHETSSITNRNMFKKFKHITYSYLLSMERYSNPNIFVLTLCRISLNTLLLLPIKPHQALGKLVGLYNYLQSKLTLKINKYKLKYLNLY